MSGQGTHHQKGLGGDSKAMGGGAMNLPISALDGEADMISTFDDFNGIMITEAGNSTTGFESSGWVLKDQDTPVGDEIGMNDGALVAVWAPSCLRIFPGTADDHGLSIQRDAVNYTLPTSGGHTFPHVWFPETAAGVAAIDNTTWMFACRIGLRADITTTGSGVWDSKAFIGFAVAGEGAIMTASTGALAVAGVEDQLLGFHVTEAGEIDGVSQRVGTTAYADGTNVTELVAASGVDGTVANGAATVGDTMWFDLCLRMDVSDWSASTNGSTQFFSRRVNRTNPVNPGKSQLSAAGQGYEPWVAHPTVLENQVPLHDVSLVPGIEVVNGPTAGRDCVFYLDWWTMGHSRWSRIDNLET